MRKMIKTRVIMEDSKEVTFKGTSLKIYTKENDGKFILQIFEGRKSKPSRYARFGSFAAMERDIKYFVDKDISNKAYKDERKIARKEKVEKLKKDLQAGVTVRASVSYTMTFNYFYRVISNKGNLYKLEILEKVWTHGDIGYTGHVKAGTPTGEYVKGKLTSTGLKIDYKYANIIDPTNLFYENHCD